MNHDDAIMLTKLNGKVEALESSMGEIKVGQRDLHDGQTVLHDEVTAVRLTSERLCALLEGLEKRQCSAPGACASLRVEVAAAAADIAELKAFQNKLVGGAVVLSLIGTCLGAIGGWVISIYFHYHGGDGGATGALLHHTASNAGSSMNVIVTSRE